MTLSRWNPLRPFPALAAVVVLATAGLGQSVSYLHLITVRHEVCAVHGALADVTGDRADEIAASGHGRSPVIVGASSDEHGDHHCLAASGRRESSFCVPSAIPGTAEPAQGVSSPSATEERAPKRPIHRLAPKHSPPLV